MAANDCCAMGIYSTEGHPGPWVRGGGPRQAAWTTRGTNFATWPALGRRPKASSLVGATFPTWQAGVAAQVACSHGSGVCL